MGLTRPLSGGLIWGWTPSHTPFRGPSCQVTLSAGLGLQHGGGSSGHTWPRGLELTLLGADAAKEGKEWGREAPLGPSPATVVPVTRPSGGFPPWRLARAGRRTFSARPALQAPIRWPESPARALAAPVRPAPTREGAGLLLTFPLLIGHRKCQQSRSCIPDRGGTKSRSLAPRPGLGLWGR